MSTIMTKDGIEIYYKAGGVGPTVVLSHGWPLNADSWDIQMQHLACNGYRVIAYDRRGHGRSSDSWSDNNMDTFADDLASLIDTLDLQQVSLIGFSMGGGDVARYIGRHGTGRLSKAALISAVPPLMLKTESNPVGTPIAVFDEMREKLRFDRSLAYQDISTSFFGANRSGSSATKGMQDAFWLLGMQSSSKSTFDCVKAFSETDFTEDLKKFDLPTLIVHGDDDQIVPIAAAGLASAKIINTARLEIYQGAPHGLTHTHADRLNADLLSFLQS
ncbi:alpha/beta fold hydrolase [Undibacterium sp. Ren11W]|uniref:alpha/beta fold hydrolase n=1 Tax=Undibacterium sp. Ren11W TaxID=3413045 RepID=UPI003BF067EE